MKKEDKDILQNKGEDFGNIIEQNCNIFLAGENIEEEKIDFKQSMKFKQELSDEEIKENYKKYLLPIITESEINIKNLILLYSGENYENIYFYLNGNEENGKIIGNFTRLLIEAFIEYYCLLENLEEKEKIYKYFLNNFIDGKIQISLIEWKDKFKIIGSLLNNKELSFTQNGSISETKEKLLRELNYIKEIFIFELKKDILGDNELDINSLINEIIDNDKIKFFNKLKIIGLIITYQFIRSPIYEKYKNTNFNDSTLEEIYTKISKVCSNQFLKYLNDSEFLDFIGIKANNFETLDIRKYYSQIKIQGNNVSINGHRYGSILQITKDYICFSSSKISRGVCKSKKDKQYDEENEINNDTYRLYYNLLEIFFNEKKSGIDKFRLEGIFTDEIDINEGDYDFNLGKHSKDFLWKIIFYYNDNIEKNKDKFEQIFIKLFGYEIGKQLGKFILQLIEEINNLKIDGYDFLAKFKKVATSKQEEYNIFFIQKIDELKEILNGVKINKIKDERSKYDLESYENIIDGEEINIFENIDNNSLAILLQNFHDPKMLVKISTDLGYDITNLSLQNQIHFIRFLWEKTPEEFENFKNLINKIEDKEYFIVTFLACSEDLSLGNKIIELSQYEGVEEIFKAYSNLVNIQSEVELDEELINFSSFLKTILKKGRGLLLDSLEDGKNGKKLNVDKKYTSELVKSGAFIKSMISKQEKGEIMSIEEFNENPYFEASKFNGGDIFRDGINISNFELIDLISDEIYKNTEIFGGDDFKKIYDAIKESYTGINDELITYLIKGLTYDLNNSIATFYLIKNKKDNKLICIGKTINENEKITKLGTFYIVDKNYKKDFAIGYYINSLIFEDNKNKHMYAHTVINNDVLERHINIGGFISGSFMQEGPDEGLKLEYSNNINKSFITKDIKKYPNNLLKQQFSSEEEEYNVICIDTNIENNIIYRSKLKYFFEKGYYITRYFYEKKDGNNDLTKTYIVFEKIKNVKN